MRHGNAGGKERPDGPWPPTLPPPPHLGAAVARHPGVAHGIEFKVVVARQNAAGHHHGKADDDGARHALPEKVPIAIGDDEVGQVLEDGHDRNAKVHQLVGVGGCECRDGGKRWTVAPAARAMGTARTCPAAQKNRHGRLDRARAHTHRFRARVQHEPKEDGDWRPLHGLFHLKRLELNHLHVGAEACRSRHAEHTRIGQETKGTRVHGTALRRLDGGEMASRAVCGTLEGSAPRERRRVFSEWYSPRPSPEASARRLQLQTAQRAASPRN